jgi:hypothetical protein
MTTEQYISNLDRKLSDLDKPDLILSAAAATHNMQLTRIFDTGVKASGQIGAYATKPMYADQKEFSNTGSFQPTGKPVIRISKGVLPLKRRSLDSHTPRPSATPLQRGNTGPGQFKNGKARRSMYLQNGYQQLKSVQGLESSFVDLTYTGDLRNDLTENLVATESGFTSGVSSETNAQKIAGLMTKYGDDLFDLTEDEKQFFKTTVKQLVNAAISS